MHGINGRDSDTPRPCGKAGNDRQEGHPYLTPEDLARRAELQAANREMYWLDREFDELREKQHRQARAAATRKLHELVGRGLDRDRLRLYAEAYFPGLSLE